MNCREGWDRSAREYRVAYKVRTSKYFNTKSRPFWSVFQPIEMVGPQDFLLSEEDGCPLASNLVLEKTLLLAIPPEALHYLRLKTSRAIMAVQDIIVV